MKSRHLAWSAVFCMLLLLSAGSIRAQSKYLVAGSLIDPLTEKVIRDPVVEIEGDRIVAVTSGGEVPDGAEVIDLGRATLLPGLADLHTHLTWNPSDLGYRGLAVSMTDEAVRGVVNARKTLMAGFTVARNLGASGYADVSVRDAIASGSIPGPRLQVSGPMLGSTGGHCDNNKLPVEYDASKGGVADGPWAVRRKVRENRKYGADVIKFCATGGTSSKGTNPGVRQYTLEEMQAIVDEAHTLGMPVAAHAHGTEGILFAIRAGADSIEHASLIDAEGLRLARRNGTFLSINAYAPLYMVEAGASQGMLPEAIEKARQLMDTRMENYRKAIAADARIVFGSDTAIIPHGDNARQFSVYVDLGMSPMRAIQSATTVAAESLGLVGHTGAVAPGYFADIIAVEGDPLADISVLEHVDFVMKGGHVYKLPGKRHAPGMLEP